MNHQFFIIGAGVASVRRVRNGVVHGLLWDLARNDVGALDAFEDVAGGLYAKVVQPVMKAVGSARAVLYVARATEEGVPRPGYLEAVVAAAAAVGLPSAYIRGLAAWGRGGVRGAAFDNFGSDRPPARVPVVTPRFTNPHEVR